MRSFTLTTLAAMLLATSATAFSLPAHVQDGYRDTGCDPAKQVDMGGYFNNPTCPEPTGLSSQEQDELAEDDAAESK